MVYVTPMRTVVFTTLMLLLLTALVYLGFRAGIFSANSVSEKSIENVESGVEYVAVSDVDRVVSSVEVEVLGHLRREFLRVVRNVGSPGSADRVLELDGIRIHTGGQPKLTLREVESGIATPYFVQFSSPIMPEWRDRVEKIGGVIHGYLPRHTLSVDLTPAMAKQLAGEDFVEWIHPIEPEHKLQPFIASLLSMRGEDLPKTIPVTISTFTPEDVHVVADTLSGMGVVVKAAEAGRRWGWIHADVSRQHIADIARLDRIQWVEERVSARLLNNVSVKDHQMNITNLWFTHGLTGVGQIIGHADTGLDTGNYTNLHQDLRNRVIAAFALGRAGRWDDTHGHGTHTAGSIFGNGIMSTGLFRGVAWEARLVHQSLLDGSGGLGGLPPNLNTLYGQAYAQGARIHANSWGSSVFGVYSTSSRQSDEFVWDHPDMLLVFAAGNDGRDVNANGVVDPDSMAAPATAKNVLTVGASENDRIPGSGGFSASTWFGKWPGSFSAQPIRGDYISQSADLTNQGMAAFSSRGPTDDGRIKPDVVAPGTDVVSTRSRSGASSGWGINANTNYNFNGGTSMSTPLVAGAAGLVRQYYQEKLHVTEPSSALIKATLMHGARTLYPGQYGDEAFLEIPAATPNHVEGWGHVDLGATLYPATTRRFHVDEKTGLAAPGDFNDHEFFADPGNIVITLYYNDYPATAGAGIKLVNDLAVSLIGPDDDVLVSHADSDYTNNHERVVYSIATSGIYRVRVQGMSIPQGPQPYAFLVSGEVNDAPVIVHIPLANSYDTNTPYTVTAVVLSSLMLSSNDVSLYWRMVGGTSDFQQVAMTGGVDNVFAAHIPAHPVHSKIEYYLEAVAPGFTTLHPPDGLHVFNVTAPVTLTVSATPAEIFSVNPGYGVHTYASGNVVRISAPAYTNTSPGIRLAIAGWTGGGSVPSTGDDFVVDVQLNEDSLITWEWVTQYALVQTSSVNAIVSTTTWWNAWNSAATITVVSELVHTGAAYGFAGWLVDGQRFPNATSVAHNPATGLIMYGPRSAVAVYLPATLDANANGLPDWWEQFYFGTNITYASVDSDNDGFTNIKEFQDRTDPRNASSVPQPPAIAHIPLANPQSMPAPWSIAAVITDNYAVSNASVFWQRNGGAWTSMPLAVSTKTNYTGVIASPGTNGDLFTYRIESQDYAALTAISGPYVFSVAYPQVDTTPESFGEIGVPADTTTNVFITITNPGLATLEWSLHRALFYDHMEHGTGVWVSAGRSNVWHIQTNRVASGKYAWHFGNGPNDLYPDHADAWLIMPPIYLSAPARLRFDHWARMEYDSGQMDDHYWDGAVVELAVGEDGEFEIIDPVGGYPHRITENEASPFPPETPCYGETDGWEPAEFDLTDFVGETVRIRFRFGADKYVREEGWYIDNVRVEYQDDISWTWLDVASPTGTLAAGSSEDVAVILDSQPLELAERRSAVLALHHNDPENTAPILTPVEMHNISREIFVTHGENGTVTPAGVVRVALGGEQAFWIQSDMFFVIGGIYTNEESAVGPLGADAAYFAWTNISASGTLHVSFTEKWISGLVPEWWLHYYGLTNDAAEVEAVTDHDGDGMLTWQEYHAGTDPLDPGSVALPVLRVFPVDEFTVVEWLSYTNEMLTYDVHMTTNLVDGFLPVASGLPATPPVNVFTNENPSPGFEVYRVLAVP